MRFCEVSKNMYSSPCDEHPPYKQPPCDEQPLALAPSHILPCKITPTCTHTPTSNLSVSQNGGLLIAGTTVQCICPQLKGILPSCWLWDVPPLLASFGHFLGMIMVSYLCWFGMDMVYFQASLLQKMHGIFWNIYSHQRNYLRILVFYVLLDSF